MRHTAIAALSLSLAVTVASADVYRSVDAQGHVQYSDTPSPGAELVHVQHSADRAHLVHDACRGIECRAACPQRTADARADAGARQRPGAGRHRPASRPSGPCSRISRRRAPISARRPPTITRHRWQARRIYRTGADGQQEYLTDEEADQQRLSLRMAMQTACGSSSP